MTERYITLEVEPEAGALAVSDRRCAEVIARLEVELGAERAAREGRFTAFAFDPSELLDNPREIDPIFNHIYLNAQPAFNTSTFNPIVLNQIILGQTTFSDSRQTLLTVGFDSSLFALSGLKSSKPEKKRLQRIGTLHENKYFIMAKVFGFIQEAYEGIMNKLSSALLPQNQASPDLAEEAKAFFGDNFKITSNEERVTVLRNFLLDHHMQHFLAHVVINHDIKKDPQVSLEEDFEVLDTALSAMGDDVEAASPPKKGKHHAKNKKAAERRKGRQNVSVAETFGNHVDQGDVQRQDEYVELPPYQSERSAGKKSKPMDAAAFTGEIIKQDDLAALKDRLKHEPSLPSPRDARSNRAAIKQESKESIDTIRSPTASRASMTGSPTPIDLSPILRHASPTLANPTTEQVGTRAALQTPKSSVEEYKGKEDCQNKIWNSTETGWTRVQGSGKKKGKGDGSSLWRASNSSGPRPPKGASQKQMPMSTTATKASTLSEQGTSRNYVAEEYPLPGVRMDTPKKQIPTPADKPMSTNNDVQSVIPALTITDAATVNSSCRVATQITAQNTLSATAISTSSKEFKPSSKQIEQAASLTSKIMPSENTSAEFTDLMDKHIAVEVSAAKSMMSSTVEVTLADVFIEAGVDASALSFLMTSTSNTTHEYADHDEIRSSSVGETPDAAAQSLLRSISAGNEPTTLIPDLANPGTVLSADALNEECQATHSSIIHDLTKMDTDVGDVPEVVSTDQLPASENDTRPAILTPDGRDAYQVLGDRCPPPLTLADHPEINKFMRPGYTFNCAYCGEKTSENIHYEQAIVCPGCGPCSEIRYCQKSHLLADSLHHQRICGKVPGKFPLTWDELPSHYHQLFPYIKPLNGSMSRECFRQMAHCLAIDRDGAIQDPFMAHHAHKMHKETAKNWNDYIKGSYPYQDKGSYYIFSTYPPFAGTSVLMALSLPAVDVSNIEAALFHRLRNACFLTSNQELVAVLYRNMRDLLSMVHDATLKKQAIEAFKEQFKYEFPHFTVPARLLRFRPYDFGEDFESVQHIVRELELKHPILRAWMAEDPAEEHFPDDPLERYIGHSWKVAPEEKDAFVPGDVADWGRGWCGQPEGEWRPALNKAYFWKVIDALREMDG